MFDAEGRREGTPCPECGSHQTITYRFEEGFSELECERCGYSSESQELSDLNRYRGDLLEKRGVELPPVPLKKLEA